jgi:hypothetical protein
MVSAARKCWLISLSHIHIYMHVAGSRSESRTGLACGIMLLTRTARKKGYPSLPSLLHGDKGDLENKNSGCPQPQITYMV